MNPEIYMQTCEVLGSTAEFRLVTERPELVENVFHDLWAQVFDFEQRFSRFRNDSELTLFNARAGEIVPISPVFREILLAAQQYGELTHGIFNPFVLPDLVRAGYAASMTTDSGPLPEYTSRKIVPVGALEIGDVWARIPENTALDLGGLGKGYLADRLGEKLTPFSPAFCLSLGGDIKVSGKEPDGPWKIEVELAADKEKMVGTYTPPETSPFGIATSGTHRTKRGVTKTHLIDPRTGTPAETPHRTCTVVANNALSADVLASCILIDGVELANQLFDNHQVRAILLQGPPPTEPLAWGSGFNYLTNYA